MGCDEEKAQKAMRWLSSDEYRRATGFRSDTSRRLFVTSRIVLRTWLSQRAGVSPHELRFTKNRYGRPTLAEPSAIRYIKFSLSHTDGLVMCAFSDNLDLGVDAEFVRKPPIEVAEDLFAPSELLAIERTRGNLRAKTFFKYWTLKEAYLKARGLGLSIPLDSFLIDIKENDEILLTVDAREDPRRNSWVLRSMQPTATHAAAICVDGSCGKQIHIRSVWVDPSEVLASGSIE
jgi:4'-phosphopantetheinyl transferase